MSFYEFAAFFIIYSFVGWVAEVAYAAVTTSKFVNRGFLNGPVCPIYGFGGTLVIACLTPIKDNFLLLFIGSVLLTTAVEFVGGYLLERFFNTKWWDYSDFPFNIKGYVCLKFSLMWGFACLLVVDVFHPPIAWAVAKIPKFAGIIFIAVCAAVYLIDLSVTVSGLLKLKKQIKLIEQAESKLKSLSDTIGENIFEAATSAKEATDKTKAGFEDFREKQKSQLEELRSKYREIIDAKPDHVAKRIISAFPNLSKERQRHSEAFKKIRQKIKDAKALRKK